MTQHKYGCHNRPPLRGHSTYGVHWAGGNPLSIQKIDFPQVMAPDCQYTRTALGKTDPKCQGCKHRKDTHGSN